MSATYLSQIKDDHARVRDAWRVYAVRPTMDLRWIIYGRSGRVLQQKVSIQWVKDHMTDSTTEWLDVPLEINP